MSDRQEPYGHRGEIAIGVIPKSPLEVVRKWVDCTTGFQIVVPTDYDTERARWQAAWEDKQPTAAVIHTTDGTVLWRRGQ